ncbi:MAG: ECF transporter S component [Actinomycetota bacterium]
MRRTVLVLVHLAGVATFIAPLVMGVAPRSGSGVGHTSDAPWILLLLVPVLLAIAIGELTSKRMDAKTIALLGVLCGLNAALRLPGGLAGASLVFFLPIVCGVVYGPTFGFLVGSLSMAASAIITGGVGPWLPFQMFASGWVGGGGGLLKPFIDRSRPVIGIIVLCAYGYFAGLFFGAVTDLWFWPYFAVSGGSMGWHPGMGAVHALRAFRNFYLVTSFVWDSGRSFANVLLIATLGIPAIRLLKRRKDRMYVFVPTAE